MSYLRSGCEVRLVGGTQPPPHNAPLWHAGCFSAAQRRWGTDGRAGKGTAPGSRATLPHRGHHIISVYVRVYHTKYCPFLTVSKDPRESEEPNWTFLSMRIRILLLIKVMQICDYWSTDPEPRRLHWERSRPFLAPFWVSQAPKIWLKGAQVWDFRPIFFYINKSYMGRRLEDWRKIFFFAKTMADIRHFVFFTQAEPAIKICLRRLSLR